MLRVALRRTLRCRPTRRLRRAVAGSGREPGLRRDARSAAAGSASRHGKGVRPKPPLPRVAPRSRPAPSAGPPSGCPRPRKGPRGGRLAVWIRSSPRRPATWPAVPSRGVRPYSAITALRHMVRHVGGQYRHQADHTAQGSTRTRRTISARHEAVTNRMFSRPRAAQGLEAASAACHYPFRSNLAPVAAGVVTGGTRHPALRHREKP